MNTKRSKWALLRTGAIAVALLVGMLLTVGWQTEAQKPAPDDERWSIAQYVSGTYLGIDGYGDVSSYTVQQPDFDGYLFEVNGEVVNFALDNDNPQSFALQNELEEGTPYELAIADGKIFCIGKISDLEYYQPLVGGTPGVRTLENFLRTAFGPVGTTLYVFGGGWNWQEDGAGRLSMSLGIAPSWVKFYQEHAGNYNYRYVLGTDNSEEDWYGYYPYYGWAQYYYAGLDCSGYLGWTLFNTFTSVDNYLAGVYNPMGFTVGSTGTAKRMSDYYGLGTYYPQYAGFYPGDVVSIAGHVWICVGMCDDESIVILHSSPQPDINGEKSGGPQLSVLDPYDRGEACQAYALADSYMAQYYPQWHALYPVTICDYDAYTDFSAEDSGTFRWDVNGAGLSDPADIQNMRAPDVLALLFAPQTQTVTAVSSLPSGTFRTVTYTITPVNLDADTQ